MAASAPGRHVVGASSATACENAVVVRLPEPVLRGLLEPAHLSSVLPGLAAGDGGSGTLTLWRKGALSSQRVRLLATSDGLSVESAAADDAAVRFRLTMRVLPAEARTDPSAALRCRLAGEVSVDAPSPGDPAAAELRHALLRLVPEVAGNLEDTAAHDPSPPRTPTLPMGAIRAVGTVGSVALAAAVAGAVVVSVFVRRRRAPA